MKKYGIIITFSLPWPNSINHAIYVYRKKTTNYNDNVVKFLDT